jgi:hypothetical protein
VSAAREVRSLSRLRGWAGWGCLRGTGRGDRLPPAAALYERVDPQAGEAGSNYLLTLKKSRSSVAASRSPTAEYTSGTWWQVGEVKKRTPDSTAPPLGSAAP